MQVGVVEVQLEPVETRAELGLSSSPPGADWTNGPVDFQPASVSRSLNTATAASAAA